MPHKLAFVLIDGIGDISVPELGNLTPLETADTLALDAVAGDTLSYRLSRYHQSHNSPFSPAELACSCRTQWIAGPSRARARLRK